MRRAATSLTLLLLLSLPLAQAGTLPEAAPAAASCVAVDAQYPYVSLDVGECRALAGDVIGQIVIVLEIVACIVVTGDIVHCFIVPAA
jgi:hypothetical protein